MFRLSVVVLVAAGMASSALAASGSLGRPMTRPTVPAAPSTPTSARNPPPDGTDPSAGRRQRDQAIQQMRAAAAMQDASQSSAAADSARHLTVFAPGGEQLLKSLAAQGSAAALSVQSARERPGESAADAVASLQPGVRSLNGRARDRKSVV
jgi:hypothetical protein